MRALSILGQVLLWGATLLVALFVVHAASFPIAAGDVFWQEKTGELIWQLKNVPWVDPFAYTAAGKEWVEHEWLVDLFYYGLHSLSGLLAFRIFFTLLWAAGSLHLFLVVRRATGQVGPAVLAVVLLIGLGVRQFIPAPSTLSLFLFFELTLVLAPWRGHLDRRRAAVFVLVFYVWCNMHAQALLYLGYLGLYAGFPLVQALVRPGEPLIAGLRAALRATAGRWLLLGVSLLVSFLTPYTYKIHEYALFGPNIARLINEWGSLFGSSYATPWTQGIFVAVALAYLISLGLAVRALSPRGWLLSPRSVLDVACLVSLVLAVRHARFVWLGMGPALMALCYEAERLRRLPAPVWAVAIGALLAIAVRPAGWSPRLLPHAFTRSYWTQHTRGLPAGAADYLLAHRHEGNLFNVYLWGGYLLYRLYPHYQVFIDGRTVLHGAELVEEATRIANGAPDTLELLDKHKIRVMVVGPHFFSDDLARRLGWQLRFRDRFSAVYTR